MSEKNQIPQWLGIALAYVTVACIMAVLVALTLRVVLWIGGWA